VTKSLRRKALLLHAEAPSQYTAVRVVLAAVARERIGSDPDGIRAAVERATVGRRRRTVNVRLALELVRQTFVMFEYVGRGCCRRCSITTAATAAAAAPDACRCCCIDYYCSTLLLYLLLTNSPRPLRYVAKRNVERCCDGVFTPDPIEVGAFMSPTPRCPVCTLPPPCNHVGFNQVRSAAMERRAALPRNHGEPLCYDFALNRGACRLFATVR